MKNSTFAFITALCAIYSMDTRAQSIIKVDSSQKAIDRQILEERINKADLVVEGKVITKKPFWNKTYSAVNTSNTLIVYKLFKGKLATDTIEVVTAGGILSDSDTLASVSRGVIVSHSFQLAGDQEGIFFLKVNKSDVRMKDAPSSFQMWDQYQMAYHNNPIYPPALFASLWFQDIKQEVYPLICNTLHKQYTVLSVNPCDTTMKK